MKYLFYIKTALILGLILRGGISDAQTVLQVVTKSVERTVNCPMGFSLNVDAEKADITLKAMPNIKEIKLKLELISKHPNLQNAKTDIDAMKYLINTSGKTIYIRNYVGIEKNSPKPNAELRVRYTLFIPNYTTVSIKNNFGKLNISDLKANLNLTAEFCKTSLANVKGNMMLNVVLSDVQGTGLEGDIRLQSSRSDIQLSILRGTCDINAVSGKIRIDGDADLSKLTINAQKADVFFMPPIANYMTYNLEAGFGKVILPSKIKLTYSEKSKNKEKISFNHHEPIANKKTGRSEITILTAFSNIEIGTKL